MSFLPMLPLCNVLYAVAWLFNLSIAIAIAIYIAMTSPSHFPSPYSSNHTPRKTHSSLPAILPT